MFPGVSSTMLPDDTVVSPCPDEMNPSLSCRRVTGETKRLDQLLAVLRQQCEISLRRKRDVIRPHDGIALAVPGYVRIMRPVGAGIDPRYVREPLDVVARPVAAFVQRPVTVIVEAVADLHSPRAQGVPSVRTRYQSASPGGGLRPSSDQVFCTSSCPEQSPSRRSLRRLTSLISPRARS